MANVDTLQLSTWTHISAFPQITLTRYMMPGKAQDILAQWTREATGREGQPITVILRGLSEILACLVPDVSFMRHDYDQVSGGKRLCLYFLGDTSSSDELRSRIQAAISLWLGLLFKDKPSDMRSQVASTVGDRNNWSCLSVSPALKMSASAACVSPENPMFYDAITAHAAASLAGKELRFRSGETKRLVLETAQSSPFDGLELVAFPPKQDPNRPESLWSEVITISSATFPERGGVHILARPSIRNWGTITGYVLESDPCRRLDLFIPAQVTDDANRMYGHSSLQFRPRLNKESATKSIVAWWEHQEDLRLLELVQRLSGNKKTEESAMLKPIVADNGLWALPRLGSIHGDRNLSGGSGVGWLDRKDIADSLDLPLKTAGFERAGSMVRVNKRLPVGKPFRPTGELAERRDAIVRTLVALGNTEKQLDLIVLHKLENTPTVVRSELIDFLGEPSLVEGETLSWSDSGLSVRIVAAAAGPLGEALPKAELTDQEKANRTEKQQQEIWKVKQGDSNRSIQEAMALYVKGVRGNQTSLACAILEMPSSLRDARSSDPYAMAKRELARQKILPQVILTDEDQNENKYSSAIRDCVRMLGIVPTSELEFSPAAITVIQLNFERVGGGYRPPHAFPLAARVRDGILECAIPEENGEPLWLPYAEAGLRILSGNYGKFGRNGQEENLQKFSNFFNSAVEQINARGQSILIAEAETIAHKWPSLQNGKLVFDELMIANKRFAPYQLPNLRVVRVSPDPKKQPTHYHETDHKDVSGLFSWESAKRTFYALKSLPLSAKTLKINSVISRHLAAENNMRRDDAVRQLAQLDEICVVFKQTDDDPTALAMLTHRLRQVHAQFDDDTRKPFPLHELRLLGRSVTF